MNEADELKRMQKLQEQHRGQLRKKRERIEERKKRTRRLIQRGAMAESFIDGAPEMTDDEFMDAMKQRLNCSQRP